MYIAQRGEIHRVCSTEFWRKSKQIGMVGDLTWFRYIYISISFQRPRSCWYPQYDVCGSKAKPAHWGAIPHMPQRIITTFVELERAHHYLNHCVRLASWRTGNKSLKFESKYEYSCIRNRMSICYALICCSCDNVITPCGIASLTWGSRNKMAALSQNTFWNAFSWMKVCAFRFH